MAKRVFSLRDACSTRNLEFVKLDQASFDFSELPEPTVLDCVYNCARGGTILENLLIHNGAATVHRAQSQVAVTQDNELWSIKLESESIPSPATIWAGTSDRKLLDKYVNLVGGFPVVIKVAGGSRGMGVMLASDYKSLYGLCDFLTDSKVQFAIREFVPSVTVDRVCVIGDLAICAASRPIREMDFRSDSDPKKIFEMRPIPNDISALAISACHAAGYNFGGVDIVRSSTDSKPRVLEVNCPHDFLPLERLCALDIAGMLVDWLAARIAT